MAAGNQLRRGQQRAQGCGTWTLSIHISERLPVFRALQSDLRRGLGVHAAIGADAPGQLHAAALFRARLEVPFPKWQGRPCRHSRFEARPERVYRHSDVVLRLSWPSTLLLAASHGAGGMRYDKLPGDWFGPSIALLVLRDLAKLHRLKYGGELELYIANGDTIYVSEIEALCTAPVAVNSNVSMVGSQARLRASLSSPVLPKPDIDTAFPTVEEWGVDSSPPPILYDPLLNPAPEPEAQPLALLAARGYTSHAQFNA